MIQKKKFKDLKFGSTFFISNFDENGVDAFFIKTQPLYYFNAEDDSQIMKALNAVSLLDGNFAFIDWDREVEVDDFSELEDS